MRPKRIYRKSYYTKLPPNTKLVARPSRWQNIYTIIKYGRKKALDLYHQDLHKILKTDPHYLEPLRGYNLACYCKLDEECHADIILNHLYNECYE